MACTPDPLSSLRERLADAERSAARARGRWQRQEATRRARALWEALELARPVGEMAVTAGDEEER